MRHIYENLKDKVLLRPTLFRNTPMIGTGGAQSSEE